MRVVWLPTAEQDLEALEDYIAEDSPQAALRISATIRQSVERLASFPNLGRVGRVAPTRELVIPGLPYIVAYIPTLSEVRIVAVVHTSRQWPESFPSEEEG